MAKHTKRDRAPALVLAAGLAAIGLFCLMLRAELRLPRTISTEGLEIPPFIRRKIPGTGILP